MRSYISRLRAWLNHIPVQDLVDRRMATLLQVMLIGIIALILAAAGINLLITDEIPWQVNLIRSAIAILIVWIPLLLLRRGYFHGSALIIIALLFFLESYALTTASLRDIAETLSFFTLAILLAGLLVSQRALVVTFLLSAGVVGYRAFQEGRAGLGNNGVIIAGNFILLNGLMSLFLNHFGITLRTALTSALNRENELQNEIVERKRTNEKLRESEERYSRLIDHARDVIFTIALDGKITSLNPSFGIFTGWPREEWVGRTFYGLVAEDDRERAQGQFNRILRGETLRSLRLRMHTRSGEILIVEMNISPQVKDDRVVGLLGIARDMTQEQLVEDALVQSEDQYRRLIEHSPFGVVVHIQGKVAYVNPTAMALIGAESAEEILGQQVLDFVHPDSRAAVIQRLKVMSEGREAPPFEEKFVRLDGRVIDVEVTAYPFTYQDQPAVQVVFHDITERKHAKEERENLITELTSKNAELEHFIYTVSHDLKSPLVTIKGFLGYLERDALSGNLERLKRDARRISKAVETMQELLRDLLELSRIGRFINDPQVVSFEELANEAIGLVQGQIQEHAVKVELRSNLPDVYGDKVRLLEVLENLLDNAVKYRGDQKRPRIEMGYRGDEEGRHIYYVKDNGIGIPPEYRERIFGLFNKLNASSEGTGVGLALVKRIIEFHGGRIWVESEEGMGSTFFFTLEVPP